jgi:integrase
MSDGTDIAIRERSEVASAESTKRARAYEGKAEASNTTEAYEAQVRIWVEWCDAKGIQSFPAAPNHVADWLGEWSEGYGDRKPASTSTLSLALSAIKFVQSSRGALFDANATWIGDDGRPVSFKRVWAGIRPSATNGRKQAAALTGSLLKVVIGGLGDNHLDTRNACLLSLLYVCALRRSELTQIDFQERGTGTVVLDLQEDRLVLTLHRSKTKQEDEDSVVVMRAANPLAFAALDKWVRTAGIQPGQPLIQGLTPRKTVSGKRMSDDGVHRAVKAAMRRYYFAKLRSEGLDKKSATAEAQRMAKGFSGHSGRVGFVVTAKEKGAQDSDIMSTTRHTTESMIVRYGAQASKALQAAHKIEGVGL